LSMRKVVPPMLSDLPRNCTRTVVPL
jgi:hypothetical protein